MPAIRDWAGRIGMVYYVESQQSSGPAMYAKRPALPSGERKQTGTDYPTSHRLGLTSVHVDQ